MNKNYVAIELDSVTYKVCLDLKAMCLFEEKSGKTIGMLFQAFQEAGQTIAALSAVDIRTLLWSVLQRHHPDLAEDRVGELLHQGNFAEAFAGISSAVAEFMPRESEDPTESPKSAPVIG